VASVALSPIVAVVAEGSRSCPPSTPRCRRSAQLSRSHRFRSRCRGTGRGVSGSAARSGRWCTRTPAPPHPARRRRRAHRTARARATGTNPAAPRSASHPSHLRTRTDNRCRRPSGGKRRRSDMARPGRRCEFRKVGRCSRHHHRRRESGRCRRRSWRHFGTEQTRTRPPHVRTYRQ